MLQLFPQQIKNFQQKILTWYGAHQRDLPWRRTRDPYNILISEVMSQQTQISRVVPKYEMWMKTLPTVHDLAKASTAEVLTLWSGLGYNRRALYLQKAAQKIVADFNGVFPQDEKVLQTLPGIGEYTSKAIVCFSFDKQVAVVDTNVRKVIITQLLAVYSSFPPHPNPLLKERERFPLPGERINVRGKTLKDSSTLINPEKIDEKIISQIATQLLPHGQAYVWNQALMDYAGSVLKKEKILIPKQSKFKDSDRYYRGQIMKLLIEKKQLRTNQLHEYFNKNKIVIDQTRLEKIVAGLEKDALIKKNGEKLLLP